MYKNEDKVLELVMQGQTTLQQIATALSIPEDGVRRIVESLKSAGYITLKEEVSSAYSITDELDSYLKSAFPEFSVYQKAIKNISISELSPTEKAIGLRWAKVKGFVDIVNGKLVPKKTEAQVKMDMDKLLGAGMALQSGKSIAEDHPAISEFLSRGLATKKTSKTILLAYTGKHIQFTEQFDPNVPAKDALAGRRHIVTKITNRMKEIMTELGFEEMDGNMIESSFWNFDALFQPQDHPAREMADTFYLKEGIPLPKDKEMVGRVKESHEKGWKYSWDPKEASKAVLRTHTTCLSARYLAAMKDKKPRKYFAIGKVFRNEATDYKHLAEFHQVEGIIVWENATFTDLLGVLKEFYRKLGFEKIRFRPSFFPYTEPSLEVEVYFESRKQWLELGGGGIFRPEVSIPLTGVYPVLAWGLSLERPLMLLLGLEDIRTLYRNDLDFLMSSRLDL